MKKLNIETHFIENQKFPASKADIVSSFRENYPHDEESLKWLKNNLCDLTYNSIDEAVNALEVIDEQS